MQQLSLRCHRDDCSRPWAHIYNGVLTVESVHAGHRHTNAVSLSTLLLLLKGSAMAKSDEELGRLLGFMQLPLIQAVPVEVPVLD